MKPTYIIKALFAILFSCAVFLSEAAGFVPVRNFSRSAYGGGTQNWAAVQDSLGRMLIGNHDGMLIFDGVRWEKHYLGNFTTVRSLHFDGKTNRIYAGGSDEFGYFAPDPVSGRLRYTSLRHILGNRAPALSEIWNILALGNDIWFQSDYHLLRYDGRSVTSFPAGGRVSRSAVIDRSLVLGMDDGRLLRFDGSRFYPLPGVLPSGRKITGILPSSSPGSLIIATSVDGLWIYDGAALMPFESDINTFLKENQIFSAAAHNGDYIFGTVNNGAVVKNFSSGKTSYINKEGGLLNNTVLSISFDRDGNIWLCLDNGIGYALFNSPMSTLIGASNAIGAGYASLISGDKIYFGTNQGLYSAGFPFSSSPSPITLTKLIPGQIWSITDSGNGVFAAGDAGLFHNSGSGFSRIEGIRGAHHVVSIPGSSSLALVSTYDRFHVLRRTPAGWSDLGPVDGYDDIGGSFLFDREGYIWFSHFRKGIYRLRLDTVLKKFDEVRLFTSDDGFPGNFDNSVSILDGKVVVSTDDGFYRLDPRSGHFVADKELNHSLPVRPRSRLFPFPQGDIMILDYSGIEFARRNPDGALALDTSVRTGASGLLIPGSESATRISGNKFIISNQEGFWCFDPTWRHSGKRDPQPFVSAIHANRDSIIYYASLRNIAGNSLKIPHELNSLRFDFAYTDFTGSDVVEFSSWLENYDDGWTPYSTETSREYTRIADGDYIFHLRARDRVSGHVSESQFSFCITPPWYRSTAARIIYVLLALAAVDAAFMLLRRWVRKSQHRIELRKEKEMQELRLEAEREALRKDYEIAALKSEQLEHDVRHKSNELSNTTMNLIRKNEILNDIAGKITKIQDQITAEDASPMLLRQLQRIQTSIRENISHDDDWKNFTRNFDIVYENYTKRLMELHPNLTAADQRLCCYIRMRLSSKEIAPLVNISYKSVEMARYRLRKKMGLSPDISLTDYLLNL